MNNFQILCMQEAEETGPAAAKLAEYVNEKYVHDALAAGSSKTENEFLTSNKKKSMGCTLF